MKNILLGLGFSLFLSLSLNAQQGLKLTSNGKFLFNTDQIIGAGDLILKSNNATSFGGIYISSPDEISGRPFYGYAINQSVKAYHYYDEITKNWLLYNNGFHFNVNKHGRAGMGTTSPDTSAILELSSINKGLLLPRMTSAQRNNIALPKDGLLVYDNEENDLYLRKNNSWNKFEQGESLWTEDNSPSGVYLPSGNVAINATSQFFTALHVASQENQIAGRFLAEHTGTGQKTGLQAEVSSGGTNLRRAINAIANAPSSGSATTFGVRGEANQGTSNSTVYAIYGTTSGSGTGDRWAGYFNGNTRVTNDFYVGDKIRMNATGFGSASVIELFDNDGTKTISINGNQSTSQGSEILMYDEEGALTLEVDGDNGNDGGGFLRLLDDLGNDRIVMKGKENSTQGADISLYNANSQNTIQIDADWGGQGIGRVVTDELEIKGGSDLAEYFNISEKSSMTPLPGMVVSIDPSNPGDLMISKESNDKKVVGVISGANGVKPGMMMGQSGTLAFGDYPVAIAGRVYVLVDEKQGKIKPGDFLTTSNMAGYAQKADLESANGAILGKAMTGVDANGYVLLLVNLK